MHNLHESAARLVSRTSARRQRLRILGHAFTVVSESACPLAIVAILEDQRRWLRDPQQRIVMRRPAAP